MVRMLPEFVLASVLLGSSSLRRRSNMSKAGLGAPRGCEGHTAILPPGWAIKCDARMKVYQSGLRPLEKSSYGPVESCLKYCQETDECDAFTVLQNHGELCFFYRAADDPPPGLCFDKPDPVPFSKQYVYYKAERQTAKDESECFAGDPISCEEHRERLRPGRNWTLSCGQGIDFDKMPPNIIRRRYGDGDDFHRCQSLCEDSRSCLGVEVRLRESFTIPLVNNWMCDGFLWHGESSEDQRLELPLGICLTAKASFPYTSGHILFKAGYSFERDCAEQGS